MSKTTPPTLRLTETYGLSADKYCFTIKRAYVSEKDGKEKFVAVAYVASLKQAFDWIVERLTRDFISEDLTKTLAQVSWEIDMFLVRVKERRDDLEKLMQQRLLGE